MFKDEYYDIQNRLCLALSDLRLLSHHPFLLFVSAHDSKMLTGIGWASH